MEALHLRPKSNSTTDVILDLDKYQNRLNTEQDKIITEFIIQNNLSITSISSSDVYNNDYILVYNLPLCALKVKCDSPHLLGKYRSSLLFKPFCGVINITYTYKDHWIMTYKKKLSINESQCEKFSYTNDIINDLLPNFDFGALHKCNEIMIRANFCNPAYNINKCYDNLYNEISKCPVKKITLINEQNNVIPSETNLGNINGITYGYYMKM
jgi:hypothetical protein